MYQSKGSKTAQNLFLKGVECGQKFTFQIDDSSSFEAGRLSAELHNVGGFFTTKGRWGLRRTAAEAWRETSLPSRHCRYLPRVVLAEVLLGERQRFRELASHVD